MRLDNESIRMAANETGGIVSDDEFVSWSDSEALFQRVKPYPSKIALVPLNEGEPFVAVIVATMPKAVRMERVNNTIKIWVVVLIRRSANAKGYQSLRGLWPLPAAEINPAP